LEGVREVAADAAKQSKALMDLREDYRRRIRGKPRAIALIDQLFVNPYTNPGNASRSTKVSLPTAINAIEDLAKAGILQQMPTGRKRGKLFVANEIFRLVAPPSENKDTAQDTPRMRTS
jgi:Fic family protein